MSRRLYCCCMHVSGILQSHSGKHPVLWGPACIKHGGDFKRSDKRLAPGISPGQTGAGKPGETAFYVKISTAQPVELRCVLHLYCTANNDQ